MKINKNHFNLIENYLFSDVASKVKKYSEKNPDKKIIKLGIGDVTLPLCEAVVDEMKKAIDEMSKKETFKGYGPEEGYLFLREKITTRLSKVQRNPPHNQGRMGQQNYTLILIQLSALGYYVSRP